MERPAPDVSLPDSKRTRFTPSIHAEFTGDERNLARDANRTSRLAWLAPELLNAIMYKNAKVQRTFYQSCRYLSMLVQDINRPGVEGGALFGRIMVFLNDAENYEETKRVRQQKVYSLSSQTYSLAESRFALRNIHIHVEIIRTYLTPGAVVVFKKILEENPEIYGIDYRDVFYKPKTELDDHKRLADFNLGLSKYSELWPIDTSPFARLRYLGVGQYMSLCAANSLFYFFFPHPSQLTNLQELHFAGDSPDVIIFEHYGWFSRLPKLCKLSISSDSNASPQDDVIVQMPFEGFSSLTYLRLARVGANQEFYQSLSSLRSLQTFKPAEELSDTTLSTLPFLSNLTALKLLHNHDFIEVTRIPNLLHLIVGLDADFGTLALSSSMRMLTLYATDMNPKEIYTENMRNLTALTQLETIIIKDPCMVIDFEDSVGYGKLIDPQVFNALHSLTNLIFDIDGKGSNFPILKLPISRTDLKPLITVSNRKGELTFLG